MEFSGFVAQRLGDLVKVARSLTADASSADDLTRCRLTTITNTEQETTDPLALTA